MDAPRYCTHCAAALNPGDQFCASCGKPVTRVAADGVTETPISPYDTTVPRTADEWYAMRDESLKRGGAITERPRGGYHDPVTGEWVRDEAAVADAKKQLKGTLPLTIVAIVVIILVVWSYIG